MGAVNKEMLLVDPARAALEARGYAYDGYMLYFEVHRKNYPTEKFWHVCTGKCVSSGTNPITSVTAASTAQYYFRNYGAPKGEQLVVDTWTPPQTLRSAPIIHADWDEDEARGEFLLQEELLLVRNRHAVDDYLLKVPTGERTADEARLHVLHYTRDYPGGGPYATGYVQGAAGQAGYLLSAVPRVRAALLSAPKLSVRGRLPYAGKWLHYNLTQLFNKQDLAELLQEAAAVIGIDDIGTRTRALMELRRRAAQKDLRKIADDENERTRVLYSTYDKLYHEVM